MPLLQQQTVPGSSTALRKLVPKWASKYTQGYRRHTHFKVQLGVSFALSDVSICSFSEQICRTDVQCGDALVSSLNIPCVKINLQLNFLRSKYFKNFYFKDVKWPFKLISRNQSAGF